MLTVRDLMSRDPYTLEPEATLREALSVLTAEGVSGAPVVTAGDRLVGVVSASDILGFEDATPPVPSRREDRQEWGDWSPPDRWLEDMSEPPSAYFRVMWDESGADLAERLGEPESPEWDILSQHTVADAMTRRVVALPTDADVVDAARLMAGQGIHRVIVTEDDRLVGILSSLDLVRGVAEGKLRPD